MANGLTKQQEAFVSYYLGGNGRPGQSDYFRPFHGTKSAIAAGYSERSAHAQASALLKTPKISAHIKARLETLAMPSEAVLAELTDIAAADWRDFLIITDYDEDGNPARFKMDLRSKVNALELLGKHHSLFTDRMELNAAESFVAALREFGRGSSGS